jgi:hypothetical protein
MWGNIFFGLVLALRQTDQRVFALSSTQRSDFSLALLRKLSNELLFGTVMAPERRRSA